MSRSGPAALAGIDLATGEVTDIVDAGAAAERHWRDPQAFMNGIAALGRPGEFLLTGKGWRSIRQVRLDPGWDRARSTACWPASHADRETSHRPPRYKGKPPMSVSLHVRPRTGRYIHPVPAERDPIASGGSPRQVRRRALRKAQPGERVGAAPAAILPGASRAGLVPPPRGPAGAVCGGGGVSAPENPGRGAAALTRQVRRRPRGVAAVGQACASRSNEFQEPMSPDSAQDTPAAVKYSGSISRPPHQAYCVECLASCLSTALPGVAAGDGGSR